MTGPQVGEVYDLRSAGEKEREEPPRAWEVVEVNGETQDGLPVLCRSIPRGALQEFPLRHFIPENLLHGVSKFRKAKAGAP